MFELYTKNDEDFYIAENLFEGENLKEYLLYDRIGNFAGKLLIKNSQIDSLIEESPYLNLINFFKEKNLKLKSFNEYNFDLQSYYRSFEELIIDSIKNNKTITIATEENDLETGIPSGLLENYLTLIKIDENDGLFLGIVKRDINKILYIEHDSPMDCFLGDYFHEKNYLK